MIEKKKNDFMKAKEKNIGMTQFLTELLNYIYLLFF